MICCGITVILGVALGALLLLKAYVKIKIRWDHSYTCLVGKTAVITGANTGIGYYTALNLAQRGAKVILACRDSARAEEAKYKIIYETGNDNVIVKLVDLASLESVRKFCRDVNENEDRLDILVNNAGAGGLEDKCTSDNLQLTWQVNHLGPFLLTNLLIDKLKQTSGSRIVNVSSLAASTAKLAAKHVNANENEGNKFRSGYKIYALTKAANILFTTELARRLKGSSPIVNAVHPGLVSTDFFRNFAPIFKRIVEFIVSLTYKTSEEGAQTSIYCAVSQNLKNVSGKLFDECREIEIYTTCRDMRVAEEVWKKSEELVNLKENEKIKDLFGNSFITEILPSLGNTTAFKILFRSCSKHLLQLVW